MILEVPREASWVDVSKVGNVRQLLLCNSAIAPPSCKQARCPQQLPTPLMLLLLLTLGPLCLLPAPCSAPLPLAALSPSLSQRYQHMMEVNKRYGSFYLQSKVFRAWEALDQEYTEEGKKTPEEVAAVQRMLHEEPAQEQPAQEQQEKQQQQ